jgi:hypothetical protein
MNMGKARFPPSVGGGGSTTRCGFSPRGIAPIREERDRALPAGWRLAPARAAGSGLTRPRAAMAGQTCRLPPASPAARPRGAIGTAVARVSGHPAGRPSFPVAIGNSSCARQTRSPGTFWTNPGVEGTFHPWEGPAEGIPAPSPPARGGPAEGKLPPSLPLRRGGKPPPAQVWPVPNRHMGFPPLPPPAGAPPREVGLPHGAAPAPGRVRQDPDPRSSSGMWRWSHLRTGE